MVAPGYFVTGTDTGVGKTVASVALMGGLRARGHSVAGMKPIASGCQPTTEGPRNADALQLQAAASVSVAYEAVNPFAFEPAIAPHVAAAERGVEVAVEPILEAFARLARRVDCVVVEGVGGWSVPINRRQTMADLARHLGLPVVLVVGLRLGCLNHALLTRQAIGAAGLGCAGWIANQIDPAMARVDASVRALEQRLEAPLLGCVPTLEPCTAQAMGHHLDLQRLGHGRRFSP